MVPIENKVVAFMGTLGWCRPNHNHHITLHDTCLHHGSCDTLGWKHDVVLPAGGDSWPHNEKGDIFYGVEIKL